MLICPANELQDGIDNPSQPIIVEAVASSQLELVPRHVDLDKLELLLKVWKEQQSFYMAWLSAALHSDLVILQVHITTMKQMAAE